MISAPNMAGRLGGLQIDNSFNSPVTIGNYITNCSYMFFRCMQFNQPITIPSSVTNCSEMFSGSTYFNQPVTIGSSVTDCSCMFYSTPFFDQSVTIPSSVTDCSYMFYKCNSLSKDINIKGTAYRSLNISRMLGEKNNSKRINVRFNSVLNNRFNVTNSYSLVGSSITWTAMTNGFYNATYNIYCYYNYAG